MLQRVMLAPLCVLLLYAMPSLPMYSKLEQAKYSLLVGYATGLALVPGTLSLPLVIGLMHIPDRSEPRIIIPCMLAGHALGYATWAAGFYGSVKFVQRH